MATLQMNFSFQEKISMLRKGPKDKKVFESLILCLISFKRKL